MVTEAEVHNLVLSRPLARIRFYHSSGWQVMKVARWDLWKMAEQSGIKVIYRLISPTTDVYAYPEGDEDANAIVYGQTKAGFRVVCYNRMVHDLNRFLQHSFPLPATYRHRANPVPPEFVKRIIRL